MEHYIIYCLLQLIDTEINPYVDQWEEEGQYPAHEVFKKLGQAGFLGITKPESKKASHDPLWRAIYVKAVFAI